MISEERIREIVQKGADLAKNLECDGSTRVLNYLFTHEGIEHRVYLGEITYDGQVIPIHYWIKIGDWFIDNKSRMWLGEKVPEGMFKRTPVIYDGEEIKMETPEKIFKLLTYGTESYWIELNK